MRTDVLVEKKEWMGMRKYRIRDATCVTNHETTNDDTQATTFTKEVTALLGIVRDEVNCTIKTSTSD